eukprot:4060031-Prymnesium_polylepis.1
MPARRRGLRDVLPRRALSVPKVPPMPKWAVTAAGAAAIVGLAVLERSRKLPIAWWGRTVVCARDWHGLGTLREVLVWCGLDGYSGCGVKTEESRVPWYGTWSTHLECVLFVIFFSPAYAG